MRSAVAKEMLISNPVDPIVAILTAERIRQGLSQSDIQRAIPCAGGLVSRVERGLNSPSLPILRRWAAVLGMDISIMYQRVIVAPAPDSADQPVESDA